MSLTCLSRTLDATDYERLADEIAYVDQHQVASNHGAHPSRRWEYALALHAIGRWSEAVPLRRCWQAPIYQIGRRLEPAGPTVLEKATGCEVHVLDVVQLADSGGLTLAPIVVALGEIERVVDPDAFLYHCSCLLAPGGLLVLTFAFWNSCGPDTAHGHQERARIYCPKLVTALRQQATLCQLQPFGGVDPTWHGPQVHDHTRASLVLEKRR